MDTSTDAVQRYCMKLKKNEMRTSIKLFTTIFTLALLFSCYGKEDDRRFAIEKDGLYGYSNAKGDTVIDRVFPLVYTDTITRIGFVADSIGQIKCFNHKGKYLFDVFKYDNGPDYPSEGLFRIVDKEGLIGFADTMGNLIIPPKYRFAYPFKSGEAKVTDKGTLLVDSQDIDRHEYWQSGKYKWYFISHKKK